MINLHMRLHGLSPKLYSIIRALILVALSYQLLYPLLYMLSMSLRTQSGVTDPSIVWIPKVITFQNFSDAAKAMDFGKVMYWSVLVGLGCGLLDILCCALAGYGFARFKFPGANILFLIVIFSIIVPPQTTLLPQYNTMRYFSAFGLMTILHKALPFIPEQINLIGNPLTMFLPSLLGQGYRAGLFIFMFRQMFKQMPGALEEAAYIDGAGPLRTFRSVMLPGAKNTIITVFLFSFVWHWNEYYFTNIMMRVNKNAAVALSTLRIGLASMTNVNENASSLVLATRMQAGSLLIILPLLILYVITQRFFTDTIENAGIK